MSHFIIDKLEINKDTSTFQAKGGDNNIVPRFSEWTESLDLHVLLDGIISGSFEANRRKKVVSSAYRISEIHKEVFSDKKYHQEDEFGSERRDYDWSTMTRTLRGNTKQDLKDKLEEVKNWQEMFSKRYEIERLENYLENYYQYHAHMNKLTDKFISELTK